MDKGELTYKVKFYIKIYPDLAEEIRGIYQLFLDEIEDEAASETHEAELAIEDIKQLLVEKGKHKADEH